MNAKTLSLVTLAGVLFAGASSAAMANDIWLGEQNPAHAAQAGKTRAQVMAELKDVRPHGWADNGELISVPSQAKMTATRSRDEVRAEAVESVKISSSNSNGLYRSAQ